MHTFTLIPDLTVTYDNYAAVWYSHGRAMAYLDKPNNAFYVCLDGAEAHHLHTVMTANLDTFSKHLVNDRSISIKAKAAFNEAD